MTTVDASTSFIVREDRGGRVAGLVLNRPEKLNAINREMIAELVAAVDECVRDPSVAVIVIRGEGRAFAAGADASPSGAMRDRSANTNREELLDELWGRFQCLWDAPKPVIAQVHGYCLGAGTILCSFADIVIVADDSEIGWPSLPLGGGVEEVLFAAGGSYIQLLGALGPDTPVGRFLASNGPGIHHVAYRVSDVAATLDQLRREDVRLIDEVPRRGSRNTLIAFVHPKSMGGVLVELVQEG